MKKAAIKVPKVLNLVKQGVSGNLASHWGKESGRPPSHWRKK